VYFRVYMILPYIVKRCSHLGVFCSHNYLFREDVDETLFGFGDNSQHHGSGVMSQTS
jgi:hypothetical protein